jgi:hypothetical protein
MGIKKTTQTREHRKKKTLAHAQHIEWTKPPTMVVEREIRDFRLQPQERKGLNLVNYLLVLIQVRISVFSDLINFVLVKIACFPIS